MIRHTDKKLPCRWESFCTIHMDSTRHCWRATRFPGATHWARARAFGYKGQHRSLITIVPALLPPTGFEFGVNITSPSAVYPTLRPGNLLLAHCNTALKSIPVSIGTWILGSPGGEILWPGRKFKGSTCHPQL